MIRMAKLLIQASTTGELTRVLAAATQSEIVLSEQHGHDVYLAVRREGITSAVVAHLTPLSGALASGENLAVQLTGEAARPTAARVSAAFTRMLTPIGLTLPIDPTWREQAKSWQVRLKASQTGESMLGEYPDAVGAVSYNTLGKKAFEQDARRYLKRVLKHLGWAGHVRYNPSGIAGSGDTMLEAMCPGDRQSVHVCLNADGFHFDRVSPSGVNGYWRFEGTPEHPMVWNAPGGRNKTWVWTLTATEFAARIRDLHAFMFGQDQASPPVTLPQSA